jgi:hypothetical protein
MLLMHFETAIHDPDLEVATMRSRQKENEQPLATEAVRDDRGGFGASDQSIHADVALGRPGRTSCPRANTTASVKVARNARPIALVGERLT